MCFEEEVVTVFASKSTDVTSSDRISTPASLYHCFGRRAILSGSGIRALESLGLSIMRFAGSLVRIVILPRYFFVRRDWIRPIVPLPLFWGWVRWVFISDSGSRRTLQQ